MTSEAVSIARLPIEFSPVWNAWAASSAGVHCVNVRPAFGEQPTVIPCGPLWYEMQTLETPSAAIHSRSSRVSGVVTGLSVHVAPPSVEVETSTFASVRLAT